MFSEEELGEILKFTNQKVKNTQYLRERILRISSYIDDLMQKNSFELFLNWNGEDFIMKATTILALRRGIKIVYAENGYFPKNSAI